MFSGENGSGILSLFGYSPANISRTLGMHGYVSFLFVRTVFTQRELA